MEDDPFVTAVKYMTYCLVVAACSMRQMLYLRVLAILACLSGILLLNIIATTNQWVEMAWLTVLLVINAVYLVLEYNPKKTVTFRNENERLLYESGLQNFTPQQFKKIVSAGQFVSADAGETLTDLGKPVLHLFIICKGKARVVVEGKTIAYCGPGNLIGEMSFITKKPASATVYIVEPTLFFRWPQDHLRACLNADPQLQEAFNSLLNLDFSSKHKVS